ncbi:DUF481 domain-containing protein [uncultured Muriicola sp.]|uniref:DUF481 domain-containing protein n=1 Tax=uncultured Muriicola sp. TaxID=1583102 RepID=UPI002611FEC8|nr:DUF481 domain-containing protein [uncultured Muriicola sp.]
MQVDSVRFVLKSDLLFDYSNNNGDYLSQFTANISTQIKSKDLKRIYMFIGSYNTERSKDQDFQNSFFLHLRLNQKISNVFRFEAFIQDQYNALLNINKRKLVGAGLRFKFISTPNIKAYFGNAYMYEHEKIDDSETEYYNNRNSSYVSFTINFPKSKVNLTETFYFQPKYSDISNHRVFQQLQAQFPINKSLSFTTQFTYFYNSFVPGIARDYSSDLSLGLSINI